MNVRRRWHHNYPEGWDSNIEDFTPTYAYADSLEADFLIMAINGFSCGYPECCVLDFMRKWWKFAHTHDQEDIRSYRVGITETGQNYAQCEGTVHKDLNSRVMPYISDNK